MESASITRSFCPSYMQSVKDSVGHCLGDAVWRGHSLALGAQKPRVGWLVMRSLYPCVGSSTGEFVDECRIRRQKRWLLG